MAKIFSEHVAALASGSSPDPVILDAIKEALRSVLRQKGIFRYGPSLLGYLGNSWDDQEAMDDLAQDCYIRAIVTRLRGLRANLLVSGDIELLVRKNIRSFVTERQRQFDPVGYAVFQNVKAAVGELVSLGILHRTGSADESISASSQFHFSVGDLGNAPDVLELKEALRQTGRLFDGLECLVRIGITAQEQLAAAIRMLPEQKVVQFSLGSLKQSLCELLEEARISSRSGRATSFSDLSDEFLEIFRTTSPDTGYLEAEHFAKLVADTQAAIEALPRSIAVKARLHKLLNYFAEAVRNHEDRQETLDELATQFDVARSTLHDDLQCLRTLLQRRAVAE